MTSSLVGSEMCIRDRARTAPRTGTLIALQKASVEHPSTRAILCGKACKPVSYTHLTLPTICSV
eukprot:10528631-Prorocentrum_lima.AAC.1